MILYFLSTISILDCVLNNIGKLFYSEAEQLRTTVRLSVVVVVVVVLYREKFYLKKTWRCYRGFNLTSRYLNDMRKNYIYFEQMVDTIYLIYILYIFSLVKQILLIPLLDLCLGTALQDCSCAHRSSRWVFDVRLKTFWIPGYPQFPAKTLR